VVRGRRRRAALSDSAAQRLAAKKPASKARGLEHRLGNPEQRYAKNKAAKLASAVNEEELRKGVQFRGAAESPVSVLPRTLWNVLAALLAPARRRLGRD
jgi:hypothetical protein